MATQPVKANTFASEPSLDDAGKDIPNNSLFARGKITSVRANTLRGHGTAQQFRVKGILRVKFSLMTERNRQVMSDKFLQCLQDSWVLIDNVLISNVSTLSVTPNVFSIWKKCGATTSIACLTVASALVLRSTASIDPTASRGSLIM